MGPSLLSHVLRYSFETWGLVGTTAESEGGIGPKEGEAIQVKFAEGQLRCVNSRMMFIVSRSGSSERVQFTIYN